LFALVISENPVITRANKSGTNAAR
jgi:hypothetical protein